MAVYAWRGVNSAGKEVKGVRDADNPKALRLVLRRDGVLVTQVQEETAARKATSREIDFGRFFKRVNATDMALTTRQLATLLRAGIPLVEALDALIEQLDKPDLNSAFTNVRNKVNEGIAIAEAMGEHPKIFAPIYVNMVAAGEAAGNLDVVLGRLADVLEAQSRLKSKVSSAVAYPAVIGAITVLMVTFMMTVVVPKLTAVFADFGQVLPWYTRLLMWVSTLFTDYWWLLFLLSGAAVWGFRRWLATTQGRQRYDRYSLRAPLFGTLLVKVAVARFARTLATLLSSGVPLLHAMEITRNVVGNTELMAVIEEARLAIREGESIAKPLQRSGRFPPIVTHMIAIGERSGELEQMLENVADTYDDQVEANVQALTTILEPVMILTMGGIIGGITLSILVPMMQMNDFVGGG